MVGAPQPQVVADDVGAVDHQALGGPARARSADAEEQVVQRRRITGVVPGRTVRADARQHGGVDGSGVDEQPRELDAVHIRDRHRGHPVVRHQGGQPQAQYHGVRPCHVERLVQVVDLGG